MKNKMLAVAGLVLWVAAGSASALTINPATWGPWGVWTGADGIPPEGTLNPLSAAQVEVILGLDPGDLTEVYKGEQASESGPLASSYKTVYDSEMENGTISYEGGPSVSALDNIYLGIKDGKNTPYWYVFDLSGKWNGTTAIELQNFWTGQGSISHATIFTGETPGGVPDGGMTIALLGLGLAGLGLTKRFMGN